MSTGPGKLMWFRIKGTEERLFLHWRGKGYYAWAHRHPGELGDYRDLDYVGQDIAMATAYAACVDRGRPFWLDAPEDVLTQEEA